MMMMMMILHYSPGADEVSRVILLRRSGFVWAWGQVFAVDIYRTSSG